MPASIQRCWYSTTRGGAKALRGAFSHFQPRDTIAWFETHGVALKSEADGRMFPVTDDATTITQCLMHTARDLGIDIRTGTAVTTVVRDAVGFRVGIKGEGYFPCDRLLLATGGSPQGYAIATALGHEVIPPIPSLFTFRIADPRLQGLAGVAVDPVRLRLHLPTSPRLEQMGACLVTHWGLSGPAVLKLSAWGARWLHCHHYQGQLTVNWLPGSNLETLRQQFLGVKSQLPRRAIAASCPVPIPRRLWERLTEHVGIGSADRWAQLSTPTLNRLLQELTQGSYSLQGKSTFKEEFVTCGGVTLKEVNFKNHGEPLLSGTLLGRGSAGY
ncbi:aminoacetone oxidase family FAD-binding enzyme [Neosynechococcus sphagnicola]|uniref:aminoacetone oxidase family FAD-binding enzyme n=1 Tax=Neosynechococcus sphagnicola TaxID=1501145 RepID=UPI003083F144